MQIAQKSDIGVAVDLLNEMLVNSAFAPETFETERGAILSELQQKRSNDSKSIVDTFLRFAYPDAETNFLNLGTEASIKQIEPAVVLEHYKKYFYAENISYIVSGDIEMGELVESLNTISLPKYNKLECTYPELTPISKVEHVPHHSVQGEASVLVGFRFDGYSIKDAAALLLLKSILAGGRSSILLIELRYKRGLVYSGGAPLWFFDKTGIFALRTSCAQENAETVLAAILDIVKDIYHNNINEQLFLFAKSLYLKSRIIEMQTSESWVDAQMVLPIKGLPNHTTSVDLVNEISSLTLESFNRAVKKYLEPETLFTVMYKKLDGKNIVQ